MHRGINKMVLGALKYRRKRSHGDVNQRELPADKATDLRACVFNLMNLRVPWEHRIS
jgi:hypothetical protein